MTGTSEKDGWMDGLVEVSAKLTGSFDRILPGNFVTISTGIFVRGSVPRTKRIDDSISICKTNSMETDLTLNTQQKGQNEWSPGTWRQKKAKQQPEYQDKQKHAKALEKLETLPPLVHHSEVHNLTRCNK